MKTALALIPILPFLGFVLLGLVGKRFGSKGLVAAIACAGPVAAFGCAVAVFARVMKSGGPVEASLFTWIAAGDLTIGFHIRIDALASVLTLVVTGVGSLIHIYSAEYMHEEDLGGYARYFAYLNLFMAMMLVLVTGANLPVLFLGWEGVGLCSYLLIGFWYGDAEKASAGKKAFIVNRIGDFGFLLGIFLIAAAFGGGPNRLDLVEVNAAAADGGVPSGTLTAAALLLFLGACGKSAQIPLYVWLPDAMAGPTPVSALIHAATMVTAGVYMVARLAVLFVAAPYALAVVAGIGLATAFFAATMALPENDVKKVLAYSTISQLGTMFAGLGAAAFDASIFHLVTHAFFKAVLFLSAGAIMHALAGETDLWKMGGLRKKLPVTFLVMLAGAIALAGLPPFAGFFSKDAILTALLTRYVEGGGAGWLLAYAVGVLTAGITAFYTFRMIGLAFFGTPRGPAEVHEHAHDPARAMAYPLIVLAVLSAGGGFLNVPGLLGAPAHEGHASYELVGIAISVAVAAIGAGAALTLYTKGLRAVAAFVRRPAVAAVHRVVAAKYRIDEAYDRAIVRPVVTGARALWEWIDFGLIDGTVNGAALAASFVSRQVRRLQRGLVSSYAFYLAGGAIAIVLFVVGAL